MHAAVASAMADVAALLLAYGKEDPISEEIVTHAQEQVVMVLKNTSASSLPLEQQAIALNRAVEEVTVLTNSAVRRGWGSFGNEPG
jgi:hypothetical protein